MKEHKNKQNSSRTKDCCTSYSIFTVMISAPYQQRGYRIRYQRLLINSTALNWTPGSKSDRRDSHGLNRSGAKRCHWCRLVIDGNIGVHILMDCSNVSRSDDMQWTKDQSSFSENIDFLEEMQLKIDTLMNNTEG